jgi:two-component sensor histidine kinase
MLGQHASAAFVDMLKGEQGAVQSTSLDGHRVVDGYHRSPLTGWTVIAAVPRQAFSEAATQATIAVAATGALGVVLSILLAIIYGRYRTAPIWRLRDDALALSRRQPISAFRTGITELNAVSEALAEASAILIRDETSKARLIDELNHRVKNSLATVQSIARQTLARSASLEEFQASFVGRLIALSRSHNALSEGGWIDADFAKLVRRVCIEVAGQERVEARGPTCALPPRAALTMGLVLHELCTNAAKYGSLRAPDGILRIRWRVEARPSGREFVLEWLEAGGPRIEQVAKRSFGTRFIEESIRHELRGQAAFDFQSSGLKFTCRFLLPADGREERAATADEPLVPAT